jgi:hypothetical protein
MPCDAAISIGTAHVMLSLASPLVRLVTLCLVDTLVRPVDTLTGVMVVSVVSLTIASIVSLTKSKLRALTHPS